MNSWWVRSASLLLGLSVCGALLAGGITREIPVGGFAGRLTSSKNGLPLADALVELVPESIDEDRLYRKRFAETDAQGRFRIGNLPAGVYRVSASTKAHELKAVAITVGEGAPTIKNLHAKPIPPYLDLYVSQNVWTPEESPRMEVRGFFDQGDLKLTTYKLDFDRVVREGSLYSALAPLARSGKDTIENQARLGKPLKTWAHSLKTRDAEGVFVDTLNLESLPEGIYWVTVEGGQMKRGQWLMVSQLALVNQNDRDSGIAFVTDLRSGKPRAGVSIGRPVNGQFRELGKTDADGLLRYPLDPAERGVVMAIQGDSKAFVDYYRASETEARKRVATYTDRPIYRPGDRVRFKGIVRDIQPDGLKLPSDRLPVRVELLNTADELIESKVVPQGDLSSYHGEFALNRELANGYYTLLTRIGDAEYRSGFSVASYRKPTYKILLEPESKTFTLGQRARVKVKAEYYFGGPVPGAKVEGYVYRNALWSDELDPEYAQTGGETVAEVSGTTDENGEVWLEFATRLPNDPPFDSDFEFNVQVSVTDEGGKYFDGATAFRVNRGAFDLRIESERTFVGENQPTRVTIEAKDYAGQAIANQRVTVRYGEHRWNNREYVMVEPKAYDLKTAGDGQVSFEFKAPRAGYYRIEADARDALGNVVRSSYTLWVEGSSVMAESARWPDLSIQLDKPQYSPNEVAKALIRTDKPGGAALVTLSTDRILDVKVIPLNQNATTFEIPIPELYVPNVNVMVAYVKDKEYASASDAIRTTLGRRELQLKVEPVSKDLRPGQTAQFRVTALNSLGQPVRAELSMGVVDESIYALARDNFDLARELYPDRYGYISTNHSFPTLYLDGGDKAPTSIEVRRRFEDTAFWIPMVMTDESGQAQIEVPLPDNLTTWRATVRGVTASSEAGQATGEVLASKPLMVRLETPEFLVVGDEAVIKAAISNRTGSDREVKLQLEGSGVEIVGGLNTTVRVPNEGTESATFRIAVKQSGPVKLTAKTWIEGSPESDGVERALAARPYGREQIDVAAGDVTGSGSFSVNVQAGADKSWGRLRVGVAPNLAATLVGPLDELIGFPYGCVEQTMSRFLPTVLVAQALKTSNLPAPRQAAQIPQMVAEGQTRLYNMQHSSGGWGWFEFGDADPHMTAYVLEGLALAERAGFRTQPDRIQRAVKWAEGYLKEPKRGTYQTETDFNASRSYLSYALALHRSPVALTSLERIPTTEPVALANSILARSALGVPVTSQIVRLASLAIRGQGVVHWKESYWGVETTARVLHALAVADPKNEMIRPAIRYLLLKRRGESWWSTRDTSYALMGLTAYLARNPEPSAIGEIAVMVNGAEVGRVAAAQAYSQAGNLFEIPMARLNPGENRVEIRRSTPGPVFYTTDLRQVVPEVQLGEVIGDSGLRVERTYRKLASTRMEDGALRLMPSRDPVMRSDRGDLIQVQLKITSDREREFILIEDFIPSSARITERSDLMPDEAWEWWWSRTDVRDDRAAFFARNVPKGESIITYVMRVEVAGRSQVLPTTAFNMYDATSKASSSGLTFEVSDR